MANVQKFLIFMASYFYIYIFLSFPSYLSNLLLSFSQTSRSSVPCLFIPFILFSTLFLENNWVSRADPCNSLECYLYCYGWCYDYSNTMHNPDVTKQICVFSFMRRQKNFYSMFVIQRT